MPVSELLENKKKLVPRSINTLYQSGKEAVHDPDAAIQDIKTEGKDKKIFLSLIEPELWKQKYIGTFKLMNNGKWEKV